MEQLAQVSDETRSTRPPPPPRSETEAGLGRLRDSLAGVYRGSRQAIDLVLTAFLAGGHVLLEDIPGVGKTTLGKALAQSIGGAFRRLQCTPDLMPSDITGVSIYDERDRQFHFHPGPVFCNVLLADELNRTPPRTQAALLEAMSERQVTVDGEAKALPRPFLCVATQNPLDHAGTYPLPDSQRDRFLLRFGLGYPAREAEADLLAKDGAEGDLARTEAVLSLAEATALRERVRQVVVDERLCHYILDLVAASRQAKALQLGASPRAALGLKRACQAYALLQSRDFVIPEDVQALTVPALAHRTVPRVGQEAETVLQGIVESLPAPR